jgi:hypothetical protein
MVRRWLSIDTRARAISFLCACALACLVTLLASGGATWRLYALLPESVLNSDRLRVTRALAVSWQSAPPDVLMLGGSQLRELVPDDSFVGAALSADCGRLIRVFNAATSSQPLESSWALADLLRRPGQLVIINLNIWRVVEPGKMKRFPRTLLPLPNAASMPAGVEQSPMAEYARRQHRLGILFEDAVTAMGLRGERLEHLGPFTSAQHVYRDLLQPAELKLTDARFQAERLRPIAATGIERNATGFDELARHLQAHGTRVAFLLAPVSPEVRQSLDAFREPVDRATAMLRETATMLDLRYAPGLSSVDFGDTLHLTTRGRQLMWPELRAFLRAQLADCAAGTGL